MSQAFADLFRDGMALVEETATYLDGPGRAESKKLARAAALAYATESMRLTTRLMQLASWLLLHRAVKEGEMSLAQANKEKTKVKLAATDHHDPDNIELLPETLRALIVRSQALQMQGAPARRHHPQPRRRRAGRDGQSGRAPARAVEGGVRGGERFECLAVAGAAPDPSTVIARPACAGTTARFVARPGQTKNARQGRGFTFETLGRALLLLAQEAGELLLEARDAAAAVHEVLLAAGPGRVRLGVDVEMHDIALLAPGGAGGELGPVGHHHLDGVIFRVNLGFHGT